MQEAINASKNFVQRRFVRYIVVGGLTFAIDFSLLVILHITFGINLLVAATISYWSSIAFNFLINRAWTFSITETSVGKHVVFYLTLLAVNYTFSILFIAMGTRLGVNFAIAKIIATGFQTIWTYIAYKKYVFK
jgi:putative flippase GtrA